MSEPRIAIASGSKNSVPSYNKKAERVKNVPSQIIPAIFKKFEESIYNSSSERNYNPYLQPKDSKNLVELLLLLNL